MNPTIYYHFTGVALRDGSAIPPIGEWLELPPEIEIVACPTKDDIAHGRGGLHASPDAYDALQYAPGDLLHKVELGGEIVPHGDPVDKYAARKRKIVATIDAESVMRAYARRVALDVIHLWDAPAIVREYLETGDESKRDAVRYAAWDALDAAQSAAWAAAQAAVRYAAWDALDAAQSAAWAAAWDAARAARAAKLKLYRPWFNEMVVAEFAKESR